MQIHATNINGLGASQVVKSFLEALGKSGDLVKYTIFLPETGVLSSFKLEEGIFIKYRRILPNAISRFVECVCSVFFFSNKPTIVLGDIPLRGIKNQIVLVHQPNLVYPKINPYSSKKINFRISRFLFAINHKFAKKIIVQTGAMAIDLIKSYPKIKHKVIVSPQPVPNWLNIGLKENHNHSKNNIHFFYPAAFYPHKKHDFLLKVDKYCRLYTHDMSNIKVWLTLTEDEFKPYESVKWLENLGRLDTEEMNNYYNKADALLFLSSMESYGLPIIEALTINLPIVVADFSYSTWLCEEAVHYFIPYKEKSFLEALDFQKTDILSEIKPDYNKIMRKFPNSWVDVVDVFQKALLNS